LRRVELGPLVREDLEAALALSTAEGWNQLAADWRRLLALEPAGCFAARDGARLIGTVTTTTYGGAVAWIGMMIVQPDFRRRGVGAALMRAALDYARGLGVATLKLDATPAGRPLYEALGFTPDTELERWQGVVSGDAGAAPVDRAAADTILALDAAAFGLERPRVIESLIAASATEPWVAESDRGGPEGFGLARPGRLTPYIGPIIATNSGTALRLLETMLARFAGREVCLDLHRSGWLARETLAERGLTMRRGLLRMRYGAPHAAGTARAICASAGPEFG
jgi:GNAT superfamily N-acetyltransferase